MSDTLNVIALISGGKDSFFSLLHCIQNGHKIIALANLYPPLSSSTHASIDRGSLSIDGYSFQDESEVATNESTDLNSFMYQTVGHSLIPLYSTVLQLPLYRRQITGISIQQTQYYDSSSFISQSDNPNGLDETEDLVPLLRQVISAHPEANAISTGAILSTYQRTRVESIAVRLGLTPLSYLWQYPVLPPPVQISLPTPQTNIHRPDSLTGLLEDAASAGLDARIIKIASAGISESLLFANVTDTRTQSRLVKGLAPFFESHDELGLRGAVLGEGGEYETITISGPRQVWKGGRIEIDESARESYTEGGVVYVKFGKAKVVPYDDEAAGKVHIDDPQSAKHQVLQPTLFDPQFANVKRELEGPSSDTTRLEAPNHTVDAAPPGPHREPQYSVASEPSATNQQGAQQQHLPLSSPAAHTVKSSQPQIDLSKTVTATTITINNLTSLSIERYLSTTVQPTASVVSNDGSKTNLRTSAEQLQAVLNHLPTVIAQLSQTVDFPLSTANISSAVLILSSISDFASVNPIYSKIYPAGLPNPPARVTIAAPLPSGVDVSLSLTFDLSPYHNRLGLHVQGRSYWAPANIGPYSQAITAPLSARSQRQNDSLASDDEGGVSDDAAAAKLQFVYIAGQIPLVPSSMQVHTGPHLDTVILGLQHLWRVGQERGVDVWPWGVAYLAENHEVDTKTRMNISSAVWKQVHIETTWSSGSTSDSDDGSTSQQSDSDEASTLDIWDIQYNRSLHHGFRQSQTSVGKHLHILPNHSVFKTTTSSRQKYVPPYLAAEVIALPRNVGIEWWSNGIGGLTKLSTLPSNRLRLEWQTNAFEWGSLSCLTITQNPAQPTKTVKFITYLLSRTSKSALEGSSNTTPTTPSQIVHLLDDNKDNTPPISGVNLVQGTAFVSTPALESNVWAHFTSIPSHLHNETDFSSTSQLQSKSTIQPQDLISNATVIPCHRLWGYAASTVPAQARNRASTEALQQKQSDPKTAVDELSVAFLLRVETI